jgi:ABC-type tungstate transport system substrate-binding protein
LDLWAALNKDDLLDITELSLGVSVSATVVAAGLGLPLGGILAVYNFPGRWTVTILLNGLLGLPPVVVGIAGPTSPSGPIAMFCRARMTMPRRQSTQRSGRPVAGGKGGA